MIGGGKLTERMLQAVTIKKLISKEEIYIYENDVNCAGELQKRYGVRAGNFLNMIAHAQVVIFTSEEKPEENLIRQVSKLVRDGIPIASLARGWTITEIENSFPNHPILRVKNNHLVAYGEGLGLFSVGSVSKDDARAVAFTILSLTGKAIEVAEEILDPLTKLIDNEVLAIFEKLRFFKSECVKLGLSEEQTNIATIQILSGTLKSLEANNSNETRNSK